MSKLKTSTKSEEGLEKLEDSEPEQLKKEPSYGTVEWLYLWSKVEGCMPSPIAVSITGSKFYSVPELKWYNFDVYPQKIKMVNSGQTVYLVPKWRTERPYLEGGIFLEPHVLGQVHFHWGPSQMAGGADHLVDRVKHPAEMHVTFFKAEYMTPLEAQKHEDGFVIICYIIRFGINPDPRLSWIVDNIPKIQECGAQVKIGPKPFSQLLPMFFEDYFMYWGALPASHEQYYPIRWIVPRTNLFASMEQLQQFRKVWDPWDSPILSNDRSLQHRGDRHLFLINPKWNLYNSLLPISSLPEGSISILSNEYRAKPWMLPPQNASLFRFLKAPEELKEKAQVDDSDT